MACVATEPSIEAAATKLSLATEHISIELYLGPPMFLISRKRTVLKTEQNKRYVARATFTSSD